MTSATFVMLSGALTFGVPLALAVRELFGMGPSRPGGDDRRPPIVLPPKPLPDCLLPRKVSLRDRQFIRDLEDA